MALYGKSTPVIDPNQHDAYWQRQTEAKNNQLLQQIADNTKVGSKGITVNNNTGGNAIVTSTQIGGF